ncbi:hypothetical protein, partial [Mycobacterium sp.]
PDAFGRDETAQPGGSGAGRADDPAGEPTRAGDAEPATEVIEPVREPDEHHVPTPPRPRGERRFTAPGFDAKETTVIQTTPEPATEILQTGERGTGFGPTAPRTATPQLIPPGMGTRLRRSRQRSWGWVLALILIILALAAVAVLGTVVLTRGHTTRAASQDEQVRKTIQSFDAAVQTGDLATLRNITCGSFRDSYDNYDDQAWADTYHQIAGAKQYPVVASIDQVVVSGRHAEANVTAFMAYAPQVRSTRSFDLQFRDDQWKICQASTG